MARRRWRLVVASVGLATLSVVPGTPARALNDVDAATCVADGSVTFSPGLTAVSTMQSVSGTLTATCAAPGDDGGTWTISFFGSSTLLDSCIAGAGAGTMSATSTSDGSGIGTFSYNRTYGSLHIEGSLPTSGDPDPHMVVANLAAPSNQLCPPGPVTSAPLAGQVEIADDTASAAFCFTVSGTGSWLPGVTSTTTTETVSLGLTITCPLPPGDDAGTYSLTVSGTSTEDCLTGASATLTVSGTGPEGAISGTATYTKVLGVMHLDGTFTSAGEAYHLIVDFFALAVCNYSSSAVQGAALIEE
jgi:hypothetical protein